MILAHGLAPRRRAVPSGNPHGPDTYTGDNPRRGRLESWRNLRHRQGGLLTDALIAGHRPVKRSSESRHLLFRCHPEGNPGTAIADRFAGVHPKALP